MLISYIGESLAALVPSSLALAQGLGKNPGCHNVTSGNTTTFEPIQIVPNFSVQVYFLLMFVLLLISASSFTFLNFSKIASRARKPNAISGGGSRRTNNIFEDSLITSDGGNKSISSEETSSSNLSTDTAKELKMPNNTDVPNQNESNEPAERPLSALNQNEKREVTVLLSLIFMLSFICYGVLPGLQSYSTLPYGNDIYNYSVNFSKH